MYRSLSSAVLPARAFRLPGILNQAPRHYYVRIFPLLVQSDAIYLVYSSGKTVVHTQCRPSHKNAKIGLKLILGGRESTKLPTLHILVLVPVKTFIFSLGQEQPQGKEPTHFFLFFSCSKRLTFVGVAF